MTKEEFVSEINDIKSKRNFLITREAELKSSFIENTREFQNGDPVILVHPNTKEEKGFVRSCYVNDLGEIKYKLNKCKMDDTESKHDLYVYHHDIIKATGKHTVKE